MYGCEVVKFFFRVRLRSITVNRNGRLRVLADVFLVGVCICGLV